MSEYLSQRRKGRKGKHCHFERREKSFLDPSHPLGMTGFGLSLSALVVPSMKLDMLGEMKVRIRVFLKFAQAAQILNHRSPVAAPNRLGLIRRMIPRSGL
jgi:hypothetical protein